MPEPVVNLLISVGLFAAAWALFTFFKKNQQPEGGGQTAGDHGSVKILTSDGQFDTELHNAGTRPVIVDFTATWCGPCKRIAPYFAQLSNEYPGVVFLKVDVDQLRQTSSKCGIRSMPTFQMYVNQRKVDEFSGASSDLLLQMLKKHTIR